ncbi:hypothetical protein JOQ06_013705 [Pogonophryne albipinna]|uniref:Uncharacterized protein n=1 Tax=Pogonophryne albipinna TaxID=1090488 RepID=A0AAD6FRJ9_9TELE|nr:hypothetical protein JOQ06_013705 [Pogonophryne albipinna]
MQWPGDHILVWDSRPEKGIPGLDGAPWNGAAQPTRSSIVGPGRVGRCRATVDWIPQLNRGACTLTPPPSSFATAMNSSSVNTTLPSPSLSVHTACSDSLGSLIIFETPLSTSSSSSLSSSSSSTWVSNGWRKATSHSDFFPYHTMLLEVVADFGVLVYGLASITRSISALKVGVFSTCTILPGQAAFRLLTCIERYLAVVPRHLRAPRGKGEVRIRNISILCSCCASDG